ncbi:MAG: DUF1214 domain-containing protein [Alphaproteobacteria bacterium]|nr:DUF1214 domain-containing protein [Alphaproteobacteria bacterium]
MTAQDNDFIAREAFAYSQALQAYIFCFPLMITERERARRENLKGPVPNEPVAPMNRLGHMAGLATAKGDLPYSPNNDTVYTGIGLDLADEPMILRLPDITDRYVSLQVADAYIENQPYLYSTRVNGGRAIDICFTGPKWEGKVPAGTVQQRITTNQVSIALRIAVRDEADLENIRRYQAAMSITALSDWHLGAGVKLPKVLEPKMRGTFDGDFAYFRRVAELMAENPPPPKHEAMFEIMRRIGLVPGKPFDPEPLHPAVRAGILRVERQGMLLIDLLRRTRGTPTDTGWTANRAQEANDFDYPTRAGNALVGLMGNDPEEALYYNTFYDGNGEPLHGGRAYKIHFPADQIPKMGNFGFWSLTMYDAMRMQFIDNPINRYALGSRDGLQRNDDGSIDIFIQPNAPRNNMETNWLPSPPDGDFKVTLRIYVPTPDSVKAYRKCTLPVPAILPAEG